MRHKDKVVIVTGAGRNIGEETAKLFVKEGARVSLFGRRKKVLERAAKELGDSAISIPGDITSLDDVRRLVSQTKDSFGRIDIIISFNQS